MSLPKFGPQKGLEWGFWPISQEENLLILLKTSGIVEINVKEPFLKVSGPGKKFVSQDTEPPRIWAYPGNLLANLIFSGIDLILYICDSVK